MNDRNHPRENRFGSIIDRLTTHTGSNGIELDVREKEGSYEVVADLTEFSEEDVDISVNDDTLNISATKTSEESSDNHYNMSRQTVNRSIPVPSDVDVGTTDASINNGVLVVTMQKEY